MGFSAEDKTILVVDDETDLCEILQFDLEDVGYQTLAASHAVEALEIINDKHVDLVVSDIRMPGGDGIHLLDSLRKKDPRDPPIIFVSGFADITLEEAYSKGVANVFSKPLATDNLLDYIKFTLLDPMERWKKTCEWQQTVRIERDFPTIAGSKENRCPLVGRGGAFLFLERDFPRLGTEFYFKLNFEDVHSSLEGVGICRWQRNSKEHSKSNGVGLEFKELSDESIVS